MIMCIDQNFPSTKTINFRWKFPNKIERLTLNLQIYAKDLKIVKVDFILFCAHEHKMQASGIAFIAKIIQVASLFTDINLFLN